MDNAKNIPCDILYKPREARFAEKIRQFQGCPTLATTRGGRIYLGWYSGGTREPHMENYNLLIYSDDDGKTWSEPLIVIPSNKELFIHALDIQLWMDPYGKLHVFWVQNNTEFAPEVLPETAPQKPAVAVDGYYFADFRHACWEIISENPDDECPVFSEPRCIDTGFLRCKPTVLSDGTWLNFNYDQIDERYGYSVSRDEGKTYVRHYGKKKLATPFDETMAYEKTDGTVRMLARSSLGRLAESSSSDGLASWSEPRLSEIVAPNSRFFISRTPSGRILLISNDDERVRKNMTVRLSDNDGESWQYKVCIDGRESLSYPDADFYGGKIYLAYDRERTGAKEILFISFTEEDIINGKIGEPSIVSKP